MYYIIGYIFSKSQISYSNDYHSEIFSAFLQFQDVTGDTFHMLALRVPSITALASISEIFQNRSELQETDSLGTRTTASMEITLLMTV